MWCSLWLTMFLELAFGPTKVISNIWSNGDYESNQTELIHWSQWGRSLAAGCMLAGRTGSLLNSARRLRQRSGVDLPEPEGPTKTSAPPRSAPTDTFLRVQAGGWPWDPA